MVLDQKLDEENIMIYFLGLWAAFCVGFVVGVLYRTYMVSH